MLRPVILELLPLIALVCALALIVASIPFQDGGARSLILAPAFIVATGFLVSGLGWFAAGHKPLAIALLVGRGVVLLYLAWSVVEGLFYIGCERASGCGGRPTSALIVLAMLAVAVLAPLVSAAALAITIRAGARLTTSWPRPPTKGSGANQSANR